MSANTNILQAVDIITDSKLKGLKFDKTIIGNISKIEDLEEGRYRIEYETGNFVVYSEDPTITYGLGESVYVKIPEGDYSNKKFIEGKVINEEKSQIGLELKNTIIYADRSFEFEYNTDNNGWYCKDDDKQAIANYLTAYKNKMIKVTGYFEGIAEQQEDYGIEIFCLGGILETKTDETGQNITELKPNATLDITQMSGDPFNRPTPIDNNDEAIPQSIYVKIEDKKPIQYSNENLYIKYFNGNTNIENPMTLKKILVEFCEIVDFSTVEYYAQINPIDGLYVVPGEIDEIELVGKLYHLGVDVTDVATGFQWYKETSYDPYPEDTENDETRFDQKERIDWVAIEDGINSNLIIKEQGQARYKLVAYYEERKSVEQIITINPTDEYIVAMDWTNQTMTINAQENDKITWYVYNYNNDLVAKGTNNKYKLESSYAYINIKCKVETPEGVIHIIGLISKRPTYSASIDFEGKDLFHYNAASNIDEEIYKQEYTLTPKLLVNEQIEKVTWSLCDLQVETEDGEGKVTSYVFQDMQYGEVYNIASSMVKNIWVDGDNNLHYSIDEVYDLQKWNNTFKIKIDTIKQDGTKGSYYSQRDIIFIRDGQQGTNGTGYCFVVRPCTQDGVLLGEDEAFVAPGNKGVLYLRPFIYYNNELITEDITMEWKFPERNNILSFNGVNPPTTIDNYVGIYQLNPNEPKYNYLYITTRAKVGSVDNFQILYYNYPINLINDVNNISKVQTLIVPKYVEYVVNGANPEWLNKDIYCQIDNSNAIATSGNSNLLKIKQIKGKNKLYPASEFDFKNGIGYLIFENSGVKIYHPIMMYLNIFGNEAINDWNGTEIYLNKKNGSILAPQIGAGAKNSDNTFTGIVMGQDYGQENKIGLYGYNKSNLTLGLDQYGNAFFGLNKEVNFEITDEHGNTLNNPLYTIGGWVLNRNNLYSQRVTKDEKNNDIIINDEVYLYSGKIDGASTNRTNHEIHQLVPYGTSEEKVINKKTDDGSSSAIKCDLFYATKYGQIGGWIMNENELFSQQCQLPTGGPSGIDKAPDTYPNTVLDGKSGIITTKYFKVFETKKTEDGGNVKGQIGYIGGYDGTQNTANLGILSENNSIILESGNNIRISSKYNFYLQVKGSASNYDSPSQFTINSLGGNKYGIINIFSRTGQNNQVKGWRFTRDDDSTYLAAQDGELYCKQMGIGTISIDSQVNIDQIPAIKEGEKPPAWLINSTEIKHMQDITNTYISNQQIKLGNVNISKDNVIAKNENETILGAGLYSNGSIGGLRAGIGEIKDENNEVKRVWTINDDSGAWYLNLNGSIKCNGITSYEDIDAGTKWIGAGSYSFKKGHGEAGSNATLTYTTEGITTSTSLKVKGALQVDSTITGTNNITSTNGIISAKGGNFGSDGVIAGSFCSHSGSSVFYIDGSGMNIGSDIVLKSNEGLISAKKITVETLSVDDFALADAALNKLADAVADKVVEKIKAEE